MTDKELLELAAKASGIASHDAMRADWLNGHSTYWNPLTDDGDALRLAVKLHINIEHPNPRDIGGGFITAQIETYYYPYIFWSSKKTYFNEVFCGDPLQAVRRAIVCAAAEIGKGNNHDN